MSCPDCFRGNTSTSLPIGKEMIIHGIPTYVSGPHMDLTPRAIIVFISDVFGWKSINNRILADRYATKGQFLVYVPDFMNGHAVDSSAMELFDEIVRPSGWFDTVAKKPFRVMRAMGMVVPFLLSCSINATHPRVVSFIRKIRASPPPFATKSLKVGGAGFCWGGKHLMMLAQDAETSGVERRGSQIDTTPGNTQPFLDFAFVAHPVMIQVPVDIEAVKVPLSVSVGDVDIALKKAQAQQAKKILESKEAGRHEMFIIPGAKHGFAIRGHPNDKAEMEYADQAEAQALAWFVKWSATS
ncbi:unnamed protein product [Clonostachys solani]|uniref:Dienelactone hydrolase domain-containing protein n=1 Tax=Clonostachys solani TaxID=160281 RepID=A0A9N9Z1S5_9HYPO|nr:unnamed protein product [Clonostachys solani]